MKFPTSTHCDGAVVHLDYIRCSIVLDEGPLFRTNEDAFVKTKRMLLEQCSLWCIVSLPGGVFTAAGAGVKTNLLFFTKGKSTEKIWYYDLTGVKVRKKAPLLVSHFDDFFKRLTNFEDSELSWTVDIVERKKQAQVECEPLRKDLTAKKQKAARWKEKVAELKKVEGKLRDQKAIENAQTNFKAATREVKEVEGKIEAIEAVYDLKAVNPNKRPVVDSRTPEELLDIIEAKGREIVESLAMLRKMGRSAEGL
jgi:type I restriction enzyme M protein